MMMLSAIIALAAALGAAAYFGARYISLGARRAVNDLESSIKRIQDLSDPRLSLMVRQMWSDRFLQFRSEARDGSSLELWLPKSGWSEKSYPWIVRTCIEMGLPRKEFIDNVGNEFVVVSFGPNCSSAAKFASNFLVNVFGMGIDEKVSVRIDLHQLNQDNKPRKN